MARNATNGAPKTVDQQSLDAALAKSVADGDIVNFRLLFLPFSPARADSGETFDDVKYAYLLPAPNETATPEYESAIAALNASDTRAHVSAELQADRPAQLPSSLLLLLADNAVRRGKYSSAAQAYELLRARGRMQALFFEKGDALLRDGQGIARAVSAYSAATGLSYDYAAFPDPQPSIKNYQTRALLIHGSYPVRPEDCAALLPDEQHVHLALEYLLGDAEAAGRLREHPIARRVEFARELVARIDPGWPAFRGRYLDACAQIESLAERFRAAGARTEAAHSAGLEDEIEDQLAGHPMGITVTLLGREIAQGAWWQYLKELAYKHPASVLFISRQIVGDEEILVPRLRKGGLLAEALGLETAGTVRV